jgi:iron complex outermembrane receptor protein
MGKFITPFFLTLFVTVAGMVPVISISAQEISVVIRAVNKQDQPVAGATITATDRVDSLQTSSQVADSNGNTTFNLIKGHQYIITLSDINYITVEKGINLSGERRQFTITLERIEKTLGAVVVTSNRPLMRQEDDKTIVDPEALANTSTSGYEVIEKTPGLFVDQDGNIYISSMSPARVYINGREMKMSTADIATMLKSLPPNSIEKIEILRTPSAKYDASGGGGIVNIVLKKGVKIGMTGSITAGLQQGTYGNKLLGFTLNNNNGISNWYLNLNYNNRNSYEQYILHRQVGIDSMLNQEAVTHYASGNWYAGFGASKQYGKKWELGYDGRYSINDFNNRTNNESTLSSGRLNEIVNRNRSRISNEGLSYLINNGIVTKYKIDSTGSEWTNDISHTYARYDGDQGFTIKSHIPNLQPSMGDGNNLNKRTVFTAQSDLKLKFKKNYTLETGWKSSWLDFNSVSTYFWETPTARIKDLARTSTYDYKENINAGYLQVSKGIKDIIIKAGTRVENTNMEGRQTIPDDTSFSIHRTDLFPYIYLSKKVMTIAGYELRAYLVYRRTILRPVYEQLNPFPRFVDQYLSEVGNPTLRPQFTQNYEANISVDERPLLAIGVNKTKDIFTSVVYQADSSSLQAYRTYDNLGKNKEWYIRGLGAIPPGGKYFFVLGGQYNHNSYDGLYENKPLTFTKGTWTLFTFHSLKMGKYTQATLQGWVRFKGQQQFYELSTLGAVNASINRQFINRKLLVTLSVNDMFLTNRNDFTLNQGSVKANGSIKTDSRRYGINLRYNFGIRKKEESQDMFNISAPQ